MNQALQNITTWDGLQDYLMERMEFADSDQSEVNPSFTKEQMWNMYIRQSIKYAGQKLSDKTAYLLKEKIAKDFNQQP